MMEWVKELIKKHTDKEGKFDSEAFDAEYKTEFAKHAVIKSDFNSKVEELKTANETLETLKKDNKDNKELQDRITEHEKKVAELETELAEERKNFALREAFAKAGAKDVDYMIYKLGDVEVNKDGSIKDLDNKIKALKEATPDFFEKEDPKNQNQSGFIIRDSKLETGVPSKPMTKEEINKIEDGEERLKAIQANRDQYR